LGGCIKEAGFISWRKEAQGKLSGYGESAIEIQKSSGGGKRIRVKRSDSRIYTAVIHKKRMSMNVREDYRGGPGERREDWDAL